MHAQPGSAKCSSRAAQQRYMIVIVLDSFQVFMCVKVWAWSRVSLTVTVVVGVALSWIGEINCSFFSWCKEMYSTLTYYIDSIWFSLKCLKLPVFTFTWRWPLVAAKHYREEVEMGGCGHKSCDWHHCLHPVSYQPSTLFSLIHGSNLSLF